jgi:RNA-binding protein
MPLSNAEKKQLRQLGHALKPVVIIADNGLSESVCAELNRALDNHELIKVKIRAESREEKVEIQQALCDQSGAELVQAIGNIVLIYKRAEKQNAKLSNVLNPK